MNNPIRLFQNARIWEEISAHVLDLVHQSHCKGHAQNGEINDQLEQTLARRFNRKYCVTVASGTDALDLAIQALNLKPRSPIAVSNYTFTASAHAISRAGHGVVPVDTTLNYCIDVDKIDQVAAVVAVDLFGNMTNYAKLENLGLPIVVDAAQSLESQDHTFKYSASYGTVSCISFSPSKTISSWGSGGAILTDSESIAQQCRKLRLHGKSRNDDLAIAPGLNSMMSSMESAAVLVGLEYADRWQQRRQQIAQYLIDNSNYPSAIDITLPKHCLSKLVFQSERRDQIQKSFQQALIDCVVHYKNLISDEPLYFSPGNFTISKYLRDCSFTVPNQHTLTDLEVERIAKKLQ